jgi:hypothetical protein
MPPVERAAEAVIRWARRARTWPIPPLELAGLDEVDDIDELPRDPASVGS